MAVHEDRFGFAFKNLRSSEPASISSSVVHNKDFSGQQIVKTDLFAENEFRPDSSIEEQKRATMTKLTTAPDMDTAIKIDMLTDETS